MDDLIRRSDAIKVTWQEPSYTDSINALTEARERIKGIPAVEPWKGAPSIDIVRCRECKYWMDDRKDEDDMGTCGLTHYFTNADDFCSYGEREGE